MLLLQMLDGEDLGKIDDLVLDEHTAGLDNLAQRRPEMPPDLTDLSGEKGPDQGRIRQQRWLRPTTE